MLGVRKGEERMHNFRCETSLEKVFGIPRRNCEWSLYSDGSQEYRSWRWKFV